MSPRTKRTRAQREPPKNYAVEDSEEPPTKRKKTQDEGYVPGLGDDGSPEDHEMDADAVPEMSPMPRSLTSKPRGKAQKKPAGKSSRTKRSKPLPPIDMDTLRILMDHSNQRRSQALRSDTSGPSTADTSMVTNATQDDSEIIDISD
ncbi:unnamed protein product [Rhizoctonia solani]|uniref:Uncharacterized protein n=1 Tax=Rhizoctonia solani TaxID=456999 RepID=A0A8H3GK74_9AGAM|nr:unnamed protein product [Rhizoctonia solani]